MARRKKITPGSIFVRKGTKKLYITYNGAQYPTGVDDTPQGRLIAQEYLENLHEQYLNRDFKPKKVVPKLKEAWELFERDHLVHKHPTTQHSYRYAFKKICGEANFVVSTEALEERAQYYFNTSTQSPAGRNVILRSFRVFCAWCTERKYCDRISFKRLIVKTHKPIRTYTATEIEAILEEYRQKSEKYYLLFQFLALTGARLTETLEIRKEHIYIDRIEMSNKINKSEFDSIPMSNALSKLLALINELNPDSPLLFFWDRDHGRIIRRSFRRVCERLGIEHHGIHSIRKTFATNLISKGVDLAHVKDLMRHRNINTTLAHYHEHKLSALAAIVDGL